MHLVGMVNEASAHSLVGAFERKLARKSTGEPVDAAAFCIRSRPTPTDRGDAMMS